MGNLFFLIFFVFSCFLCFSLFFIGCCYANPCKACRSASVGVHFVYELHNSLIQLKKNNEEGHGRLTPFFLFLSFSFFFFFVLLFFFFSFFLLCFSFLLFFCFFCVLLSFGGGSIVYHRESLARPVGRHQQVNILFMSFITR